MPNYKPNNPFRSKIVFFEGLDKSGKSTLCRRARFESGHEVLMFDRGFVGRRVFYEFREETRFPIDDWNRIERLLQNGSAYAVIYLDIQPLTSLKRQRSAGEMPEFSCNQLAFQRKLYLKEIEDLETLGVPVLRLDTETDTEDFSLEKILIWIKGGKEWI